MIAGAGPEEGRLRSHAAELGVADLVEIRPELPYSEMPALFAGASCLVLASLPTWFWEEQFGMVLAEAMAARVPIIASGSGAIPEVLDGQAPIVAPGDWVALARALAEGPLARQPGARAVYADQVVERYSASAFAERLAGAYDEVLGGG